MRYVSAAQPHYPAEIFAALKHALHRRTLDDTFLPTIMPPPGNQDRTYRFSYLREKIERLTEAILGVHLDFKSVHRSNQPVERPPRNLPLPPLLRERVFSALTGIEAEAVDLGKSIELNNFRMVRRDPRARSEEDLGAWRNDAHKRWNLLADQLVRDVNTFWDMERRKSGSRL